MFLLKSLLEALKPKNNKSNFFEPLLTKYENDSFPSPGEIRKSVKNMARCFHCHFLIFDNYWSHEVQKSNVKLCPTCGSKF